MAISGQAVSATAIEAMRGTLADLVRDMEAAYGAGWRTVRVHPRDARLGRGDGRRALALELEAILATVTL
jgi:hypothetical protein